MFWKKIGKKYNKMLTMFFLGCWHKQWLLFSSLCFDIYKSSTIALLLYPEKIDQWKVQSSGWNYCYIQNWIHFTTGDAFGYRGKMISIKGLQCFISN